MNPLTLAAGAAALAMVADVPLAQKYPLADRSVTMTTRVAVTGGLVFASVFVAAQVLRATAGSRPR